MSEQYNNEATPTNMWDDSSPPRRHTSVGRFALALIVIGLCLFGAGWLMGARGGRVYLAGPEGFNIVASRANDTAQAQLVDITAANIVQSLTVNATSGSIQLYATNSDRLYVSGSRRGITINENGGNFHLDSSNSSVNIGIIGSTHLGVNIVRGRGQNSYTAIDFNFDRRNFRNRISNNLRIYVPSSVQDIYAHTRAGSVTANDISTNQLHLQTSSGGIRLQGGTHNNTHLETRSGGIRANGNFAGNVSASTSSGGIHVHDYNTSQANNTIRLETRSGGVRYESSAPRSDFSYNLSVGSGSMRIDGNRLSGRNYSGGNGNSQVYATTRSGGIQLSFGR